MIRLTSLLVILSALIPQNQVPAIGSTWKGSGGGGGGTWSHTGSQDCNLAGTSTTSCTYTSGSGHLMVLSTTPGSNVTVSSASGECSGSWVHPSSMSQYQSTTGAIDSIYCTNSSSGTTLSVTFSGSSGAGYCHIDEFAWSGSTIAVDSGQTNGVSTSNSSGATNPSGESLTINGAKDVIVQVYVPSGAASAISGSYVGDFPGGYGFAYLLNTTSGTAPTWTGSGAYVINAIAFAGS